MFKKLVCMFLLISLVGRISIAQTAEPIFTSLKAGEVAKFSGYLFSPEAIVKIYSKCEEDLQKKEIECNSDNISLNLELQRIKELNIIEVSSKNKLIEDLTKLKNDEISAREKLLSNLESERLRNKFFIAGSFVAGILLTGSVVYLVSGLTK